jgi:transcriptional regulator with XRE-family HTH domain
MTRSQVRHLTLDSGRVRELRAAAGLTNEQLAHEVGVTLRTVQRWQLGSNEPNGAQLLRLARVLGVHPDDLYLEQLPAA